MNTRNLNGRAARVPGDTRRFLPLRDRTPLRDRVLAQVPTRLTCFEQTLEAVKHDDLGKRDLRCTRSDLAMKSGALCVSSPSGEEERLRPTRWAIGQLCARLGIPASYFAACPSILQDIQANYWLQDGPSRTARRVSQRDEDNIGPTDDARAPEPQEPTNSANERWLLRAKGDTVRAVLSSTYSPLDNKMLFETLAPLIHPRLRVDWFALSDETLHLRLIDPTKTREVLPGDGLSVGVHISNSEVGARSLCVDALVYRLVCSNGLIALVKGQSLLRRRHVHMAPLRFQAAIAEAVESAFTTAEGFLERLRDSTRQSVPDPENAIEKIGERWGLSEPVREAAKVALWREEASVRESAFALVNAFTGVAQLLTDEKRYDLEVLAGHLAENGVPAFALSPREKQIAVGRSISATDDVTAFAQKTFEAQIVSRRPMALAREEER